MALYHRTIKKEVPKVKVHDFDLADYEKIWEMQKQLAEFRVQQKVCDALLVGEHYPVITLGRGTKEEEYPKTKIPVVEVERGGQATYHAPGQLIAYPVMEIPPGRRDLHLYLRDLEDIIINTLAEFGIEGVRNEGFTGVWVQAGKKKTDLKKIASVGVAVKRWVAYHGISINVDMDLDGYQQINPCGLDSQVMVNMKEMTKKKVTVDKVKSVFCKKFVSQFEMELLEPESNLTAVS